jgi:hypothetical protein
VLELRARLRFAHEHRREPFAAFGQRALLRDAAAQHVVEHFVDASHAAATELVHEDVTRSLRLLELRRRRLRRPNADARFCGRQLRFLARDLHRQARP